MHRSVQAEQASDRKLQCSAAVAGSQGGDELQVAWLLRGDDATPHQEVYDDQVAVVLVLPAAADDGSHVSNRQPLKALYLRCNRKSMFSNVRYAQTLPSVSHLVNQVHYIAHHAPQLH